MGSKENPGRFDCYKNAKPLEPMFVLLARDPIAPIVISFWCVYRSILVWAKLKPMSDLEMIAEARDTMAQMTKWREENWHG